MILAERFQRKLEPFFDVCPYVAEFGILYPMRPLLLWGRCVFWSNIQENV